MNAVAYAVVRDEPPTVYAAESVDVLQRLLALEVVARSVPAGLDPNAKKRMQKALLDERWACLLYTSPSPRDRTRSRMPSSA